MGVWLVALTLIACGGKINKVLTEADTTVAEDVIPLKDTLLNIEDQMPETAVRQPDAHFQYAVYINEEKPASGEGEMDAVKSVWLCNERSGTVIKVCETNPTAEALWSPSTGKRRKSPLPLTVTTKAAAILSRKFIPSMVSSFAC